MPEAVIVATGRSAIGRANKGSLADVRPEDILGEVMKAVVAKSGVDPSEIDDVICGSVGGAQINIARSGSLLAGIPQEVPGTTVNRYCSSSLQAIRMAFHAIKAGEGDTYLCGGSERTSRLESERGTTFGDGRPMGPNPELHQHWELFIPMGMTAENVADKFNVTRERMDEYAKQSQDRAVAAQENGFFDREIVPFTKEDGSVVAKDDGPRPGTTLEKLAELKPVFRPEGGRVTAGNACPLNDGAAAVMVMSEDRAKAAGIKPIARIIASGVSGLDPRIMGVGPIEAVKKALAQANMKIDDVDIMELNEAFAAQVLPVCDEVGMDPFSDRFNPQGGAIALGHPFGQTGARIMTTLLNGLQSANKTVGLETMCVGGGQGLAMIVERVN
jgi:acetyl-CoA C-acetyltransferase